MINPNDYSLYSDEVGYIKFFPLLCWALDGNEKKALILVKIDGWLKHNAAHGRNFRDGRVWTYNTYGDWVAQEFIWFSEITLKRRIIELEKAGFLVSQQYETRWGQMRKWYSIDYERLSAFLREKEVEYKTDLAQRLASTEDDEFADPINELGTSLKSADHPTDQIDTVFEAYPNDTVGDTNTIHSTTIENPPINNLQKITNGGASAATAYLPKNIEFTGLDCLDSNTDRCSTHQKDGEKKEQMESKKTPHSKPPSPNKISLTKGQAKNYTEIFDRGTGQSTYGKMESANIDLTVPPSDDKWWSHFASRWPKKKFASIEQQNLYNDAVARIEMLEYGIEFLQLILEWSQKYSWGWQKTLDYLFDDGKQGEKSRDNYVYWLDEGLIGPQKQKRKETNATNRFDLDDYDPALVAAIERGDF